MSPFVNLLTPPALGARQWHSSLATTAPPSAGRRFLVQAGHSCVADRRLRRCLEHGHHLTEQSPLLIGRLRPHRDVDKRPEEPEFQALRDAESLEYLSTMRGDLHDLRRVPLAWDLDRARRNPRKPLIVAVRCSELMTTRRGLAA